LGEGGQRPDGGKGALLTRLPFGRKLVAWRRKPAKPTTASARLSPIFFQNHSAGYQLTDSENPNIMVTGSVPVAVAVLQKVFPINA
jgi:hypothetical protein